MRVGKAGRECPVHDKRRPAFLDNEEFCLMSSADELGSLDEEDDEGTRGRSTIDVNAVASPMKT